MDAGLLEAVMGPIRAALGAVGHKALSEVEDEDFRSALRGQVNKALSGADGLEDPGLGADLKELLDAAGVRVSAEGAGSVAVGRNEGIISTGGNARNTVHRGGA